MAQREKDGVIYEQVDGGWKVVGYTDQQPQGIMVKPAPPPPAPPEPKAMQAPAIPGYVFNPNTGQYVASNVTPPAPTGGNSGVTAKVRADAIQAYSDAGALERAANEIEALYKTGPGATKGVQGLADYLPTDTNKVFDDAGQRARGYVKRALGFTGGEGNTVAESSSLYDPYLPSASDRDAQIEQKVQQLRQLAMDSRKKSVAMLGGKPDPNGQIVPVTAEEAAGVAMPERDDAAPGANVPPSDGAYGSTNLNNLGGPAAPNQFARDGASITERDMQVQAALQQSFDRGDDINAMAGLSRALGYSLPDGFEQYVGQRDKAISEGRPFRINIGTPESGEGMGALGNLITSPAGTAATMAVNATTLGGVDEIGGMFGGPGTQEAIDAAKGLMRQENPLSAMAGEMAGAVLPMVGAGRLAGMASRALPAISGSRAALLGDVGYSAVYGAGEQNDNRALGALIGGGAGLAGNAIGSYVAAPIVRGVQGTQAGQNVINRTRGLFGKPAIAVQPALAPEQAMALKSGLDIDQVMSTLTDAQRLNLPMALADADPRLRMLAGSATRKSPDVRALAERNLEPRQMGQAERAMGAIRRDFAAPVNMRDTREEIIQQGRAAAAPLYEQAYGAPIIQTPELTAVLGTPAGRGALGRANTIAANERRNPQGMGFALDADGNVVLNPTPVDAYGAQAVARAELTDAQQAYKVARQASDGPSMEAASNRVVAARDALREADNALAAAPREGTAATMPGYTTQSIDYVKRGLDDILEARRDPITRQLVLDEAGRAEQGVRRSLVGEMDRLNPAYKDARGAYEQYAKQATALDEGYGATSRQIGQDDLARMLGGMEDPNLGRFQTGYATGLTEQVEKMPFGSNPYGRIYGSPDQQAKIGMAFPEGAGNFARQADLERDMAKTYQEALGGSPTAARLNADQQFDMMPGVGMAADVATSAMAGAPVTPNLIARMGRGLTDSARVGFGTRRADAIGPVLLDTNPQAAMDFILKAQQEKALRDAYVTRTRRTGGLFGVPFAVGAVGAANQ